MSLGYGLSGDIFVVGTSDDGLRRWSSAKPAINLLRSDGIRLAFDAELAAGRPVGRVIFCACNLTGQIAFKYSDSSSRTIFTEVVGIDGRFTVLDQPFCWTTFVRSKSAPLTSNFCTSSSETC